MGSLTSLTILGISLGCVLASCACLIAGAYGESWFSYTDDKNIGLWRKCETVIQRTCTTRERVLKFNSTYEIDYTKDLVLVLIIGSASLAVLSMLPVCILFCVRKSSSKWRCMASILLCTALLGAMSGFAGLGYAEYKFKTLWQMSDHGWSVLLTWVGATALLLGSFLGGVLLFVVPNYTDKQSRHSVHYVGKTNPTYNGDSYY